MVRSNRALEEGARTRIGNLTMMLGAVFVALLASSGSGEASMNAPAETTSQLCSQFPSISLDGDVARGVEVATARDLTGRCRVVGELGPSHIGPPNPEESACRVELLPAPVEQGVVVETQTSGQCEGTTLRVDVELPGARADGSQTTAMLMTGFQRLQAKIVGHDVLHLPMFITWANIEWYYDDYTVWGGTFPYGNDDDGYWDVVFNTHGSGFYTPDRYEHYHYTHWHSDGFPSSSFPDVDAWAQPTAKGYPYGTGNCSFWFSPGSGWGSYPSLHTWNICQYY